jgi:7-cyano-7-deazaguanine synthase in queuosine biosynthesis
MKTVMLNSGGLDSLALAVMLSKQGHEVHSLYVDTGSKNREQAMAAASKIAAAHCADHYVIAVDGLKTTPKVARGIPYQGFFFTLLGSIYAASLDIDYVTSGNKGEMSDDSFEETFMNVLKSVKVRDTKIPLRPFRGIIDINQIYMIAKDSPVLKDTWSCGQSTKCGVCNKCRMRIRLGID